MIHRLHTFSLTLVIIAIGISCRSPIVSVEKNIDILDGINFGRLNIKTIMASDGTVIKGARIDTFFISGPDTFTHWIHTTNEYGESEFPLKIGKYLITNKNPFIQTNNTGPLNNNILLLKLNTDPIPKGCVGIIVLSLESPYPGHPCSIRKLITSKSDGAFYTLTFDVNFLDTVTKGQP